MKHGTLSCYTRDACRCQVCRDAMASYHRQHRKVSGKRFGRLYRELADATNELGRIKGKTFTITPADIREAVNEAIRRA